MDLNRLRLEDDGIIGKKYPKLPRTTIRIATTHGNVKTDYSSFDHQQFLDNLIEKLQQDIKNSPNFIRVALYSMHKKTTYRTCKQISGIARKSGGGLYVYTVVFNGY